MTKDKLTPKQEMFCQKYIYYTGNAKRAYMDAYNVTKENSAEVNASRLLSNVKVSARIKELSEQIANDNIASSQEVLGFITQVMRGEIEVTKEQMKASELLGKVHRLFIEKVEVDGTMDIEINLTGLEEE